MNPEQQNNNNPNVIPVPSAPIMGSDMYQKTYDNRPLLTSINPTTEPLNNTPEYEELYENILKSPEESFISPIIMGILNIVSFGYANTTYNPPNIMPSYWQWRFGLKYFVLCMISITLFFNALFIYKINTYNTIYGNQKIIDDISEHEQHVFDPFLFYLGSASHKDMIKNSKYGKLLKSNDAFTTMNENEKDDRYDLYKTLVNIYLAIKQSIVNIVQNGISVNYRISKIFEILNRIMYNGIVIDKYEKV